jgi:hypothetical protein
VVPGSLRASGRLFIERVGKIVKAIFSFGGPAIDYAVVQHERLDYLHTTGQAKYVESVLDESAPHIMNRLGARLRLDGDGEAGE